MQLILAKKVLSNFIRETYTYRTRAIISAVCIIFTPFFFFTEVYITDHLCTKNENSSFFQPKIRGLYTRAVSDQERVIMARVRYIVQKLDASKRYS